MLLNVWAGEILLNDRKDLNVHVCMRETGETGDKGRQRRQKRLGTYWEALGR